MAAAPATTATTTAMYDRIMERHSCKAFDSKPLAAEAVDSIKSFLASPASTTTPFNPSSTSSYRFVWTPESLATGLFNQSQGTIIAVIKTSSMLTQAEVELSYCFERIHLECLMPLNLATCWVSLTFNRVLANKLANVVDGEETVLCVFPVGFKGQAGLVAKGAGWFFGVGTRKSIDHTACDGDLSKPFMVPESHALYKPINAVVWAPSAYNKQVARVVVTSDNAVHVYCQKLNQYTFQDGGIAVYHFDVVATELGIKGKWVTDHPATSDAAFQHIASFIPLN